MSDKLIIDAEEWAEIGIEFDHEDEPFNALANSLSAQLGAVEAALSEANGKHYDALQEAASIKNERDYYEEQMVDAMEQRTAAHLALGKLAEGFHDEANKLQLQVAQLQTTICTLSDRIGQLEEVLRQRNTVYVLEKQP